MREDEETPMRRARHEHEEHEAAWVLRGVGPGRTPGGRVQILLGPRFGQGGKPAGTGQQQQASRFPFVPARAPSISMTWRADPVVDRVVGLAGSAGDKRKMMEGRRADDERI